MTGRFLALVAILGCCLILGTANIQAKSDEAIRRNNFGAELVKQGRLAEAIAEFQRAVELDPTYVAAQRNLGYAYDRQGQMEEAVAAYRKAIELEPGDMMTRNTLGVLYDKKGKYTEAIGEFEKALQIDPANSTVKKNLENARNNMAIIQERVERIAQARKDVDARPNDPRAAYNLARVYASFDDRDQAFEWLAKAFALGFDDFGFVKVDPVLAGLRSDPRFAKLMERR
jgi:tetratricopeptide (TPR) repeat protein